MKAIAVIPARGGSKRIPDKNIRPFCGRPMLQYAIDAARSSQLFARILVSTDSPQIAECARAWGAEVPFMRPASLADDHATTDEVFLHALDWLEQASCRPEAACCLYATVPFLQPDDLGRGLRRLEETQATTCFPVATYDYPFFRALRINAQGRLELVWPDHRLSRSQDLPEVVHDAGQFYWVNVAKFKKERRIMCADAVPVSMPRSRVQDIDTVEDWRVAELKYRILMNETRGAME